MNDTIIPWVTTIHDGLNTWSYEFALLHGNGQSGGYGLINQTTNGSTSNGVGSPSLRYTQAGLVFCHHSAVLWTYNDSMKADKPW